MSHLSKFTHHLFQLALVFCLVFASLFTFISPVNATSSYPSRNDLATARHNIQAVGEYAKYATLASAITATELDPTNIDTLISAMLSINPLLPIDDQGPFALISDARNLPFYKEYAYLRTLVNEIIYLSDNYEYISSSEEAWKLPYIIDRAENAIEGCNLIFGTNRQPATTASQIAPLADTDPYTTASATIIAEYAAKTDVLRSSDATQLPRRHSSNTNTTETQPAPNQPINPSNSVDSSTQTTANDSTNSSTATDTNTPSVATENHTDDGNHSSQQTLVAVAAHTSTAITAVGTLVVANRRLRKKR